MPLIADTSAFKVVSKKRVFLLVGLVCYFL